MQEKKKKVLYVRNNITDPLHCCPDFNECTQGRRVSFQMVSAAVIGHMCKDGRTSLTDAKHSRCQLEHEDRQECITIPYTSGYVILMVPLLHKYVCLPACLITFVYTPKISRLLRNMNSKCHNPKIDIFHHKPKDRMRFLADRDPNLSDIQCNTSVS